MEGYRYLITFQLAEVIYQLNFKFISTCLAGQELYRQRQQMDQAARSSKQCIAEGYDQGTSLKGYIKMLGVSKGSYSELKLDYEDYLKRHNLAIWNLNHPKIREFREFRVRIIGRKKDEFILNTPETPKIP